MDLQLSLYNKFQEIYPECQLQLITHHSYNGKVVASVFYYDRNGNSHIETYDSSTFDYHFDYLDEGGNLESLNTFKVTNLFENTLQKTNQTKWFDYNTRYWRDTL